MALYEIKEEKERVILVGVSTRENDDTEDSLDELKDLVKTAGAEDIRATYRYTSRGTT